MAGRVGVLPAHFVTLTLYVKEKSAADGLEKIARESFSDWNPSTTVVETKELRVTGALVEGEAVAMIRPPNPVGNVDAHKSPSFFHHQGSYPSTSPLTPDRFTLLLHTQNIFLDRFLLFSLESIAIALIN